MAVAVGVGVGVSVAGTLAVGVGDGDAGSYEAYVTVDPAVPADPVTALEVPVLLDALFDEEDDPPEREMDETPPSEASVKSVSTVWEMVPVEAVVVR